MNMRRLSALFPTASIILLVATHGVAQSNIVSDGSFESLGSALPSAWEFPGGYGARVNEHGAADGKCWLTAGNFAQNVATAAGRTYRIRFALSSGAVNVTWNGGLVGVVNSGGGGWTYTNLYVPATGAVSRVGFALSGDMDDVSVGWM